MSGMHFFASRGSLQRRLSLILTTGLTALWLLGTFAAGYILREEIDEVFDSALQEVVQRVLPLAYTEILNRENGDATPQQLAPVGVHKEYITYIVRDGSGRVLLQSHDAEPERFPIRPADGFISENSARYYTERAVKGSIIVTASERPGHRQKALRDAMTMLILPLVLLLPCGILGTWAAIIWAFVPVVGLRDEIEIRGSGNLAPLEMMHLPAEIGPIADAVNRLMERLRRALEVERAFTANSAHELRTPVAAALAQTQRLRTALAPGVQQERADDVEAALRRLARLSEKLLQLAKAEGSGLMAEEPVDLVPVLTLVIDDLERSLKDGARLDIDMPEIGAVFSRIDMDAFAILARNLVENALKYGDPEGAVIVRLGAGALFCVANHGPVVLPSELERLTRRFERGTSEADGAGLGLAIAVTIAEGIGARLELLSPASGFSDGFEARIQLPLASKP